MNISPGILHRLVGTFTVPAGTASSTLDTVAAEAAAARTSVIFVNPERPRLRLRWIVTEYGLRMRWESDASDLK
jgi:hypothetical protein